MRGMRRAVPAGPSARRTSRVRRVLRRVAPVVVVATVSSTVLTQAPLHDDPEAPRAARSAQAPDVAEPVDPPAAPVAPAAPDEAPAAGEVTTEEILPVATERVVIRRRKGTVRGDGLTEYVANRTTFRPGPAAVALPPRVRARAWVVVDLDSGRILGKHRARAHLPQASTLKLLSAVTATQTIRPGARHRVTKLEDDQVCACAGVRKGRVYDRDTLLAGMLLPSGNDAAEALAGSHPQGRQGFYRAMNDLAHELGATDTVARNASGLTAAGSHSSARDLVLMLRAAVADPTVRGVLAQRSATIATVRGRPAHAVWRATDYVNRYPASLGKSGWTTPAQNTLAVVSRIRGRRVAVATLGAPTGYSSTGTRALARWAAVNFDGLEDVGRLPHS